jgi:5S rRNA maturation endonuclease (ribonuclease M5)
MSYKRKKPNINVEEIKKFLNKCKNLDAPIIVEGEKDKRILESFGFKNIISISGETLENIASRIKSFNFSSVVILTDFDSEGRRKFYLLKKYFQANGIFVNVDIRKKIKFLFRIGKIEEMKFYQNYI